MSNALFTIQPWKDTCGLWMFNDAARDVYREPFVQSAGALIDAMVAQVGIPDAESGITIVFSANPFPGFQVCLEKTDNDEFGGTTYVLPDVGEGWLCPCLLKYFPNPPDRIYVQILPLNIGRTER